MNYHIEHHMYAAVAFYNLPELHEIVKEDMPVPCRGVLGTWRQIIPNRRRQQIEPDYQFAPELPHASKLPAVTSLPIPDQLVWKYSAPRPIHSLIDMCAK